MSLSQSMLIVLGWKNICAIQANFLAEWVLEVTNNINWEIPFKQNTI